MTLVKLELYMHGKEKKDLSLKGYKNLTQNRPKT